jgi:hypothetical protein
MQEIKWGIIGCGNVTEVKSGPAFNKVPSSKLLGVMRRDPILLKDYALRHSVPLTFTNGSDLINHPDINAIYIATPPNVHEQFALEALRAHKFVYVEKPMATQVSACINMQNVANELGGKLVIAHYRRALPLFLKIKSLLAENYIGSITDVKIRMHKKADQKNEYENNWRVNKNTAGGGLFYDLAPHQLDLVFYFFGDAISYEGSATNKAGLYEVEDTVKGTMNLYNDIQFEGEWCFAMEQDNSDAEKDEFIIQGENGTIQFAVFGHQIEIIKQGKKEIINFDPPAHIQQPMIEKVVNYFLGKADNPCSDEEAIKSMRVMEAFVYGRKN